MHDPRYVAARRVLLDALEALAPHSGALIVAGAQAVYLRTATLELSVAPYTTDGDLALDPSTLEQDPALQDAMRTAGFELLLIDGHVEPGIWVRSTMVDGVDVIVPVDLIVPTGVAPGGGRRSVRLDGHDRRAARRVIGLEAALVDRSAMTIGSLDAEDPRSVDAQVAGVAALLVAKAHKLNDRAKDGRERRLNDKDAADVVRLMQGSVAANVAATIRTLLSSPIAGQVTSNALGYLDDLFSQRGQPGVVLASRALRLALSEETVEALCIAWMRRLRAELE